MSLSAIGLSILGASVLIACGLRGIPALFRSPQPQPIRLRDIADSDTITLLNRTEDPSIHPALREAVHRAALTITALRTAGYDGEALEVVRAAEAAMGGTEAALDALEAAHRSGWRLAIATAGPAERARS